MIKSSKLFTVYDSIVLQKREKFIRFQVSAIKARNEYLLCVDAANAALHQYYANDISDVIDVGSLRYS